jgi:membrane-associated phospholipid phosphatase
MPLSWPQRGAEALTPRSRPNLGRSLVIIALVLKLAATTRNAQASEPHPLSTLPSSADARRQAEAAPAVRWRDEWKRVRWWEYAGTAAFMATAFSLRYAGPPPPDNWRGGVLFDDVLVRNVTIEDQSVAHGVEVTTDALFYGAMGYRLVDSVFVPLVGYQDPDLALQMTMIDLGAFSVQAMVLWGSQTLVGRTRPLALRCDEQPADMRHERCAIPSRLGPQRSFIAGHPATGFTAAGLTCQHHRHIPLYGGWGDTAACATTLVAATVNGLGRVLAEQHYPTDLLLGVALGAFSGWVLPGLLHYGFGPAEKEPDTARSGPGLDPRPWSVFVLPDVQEHRLGARMGGWF